jgi:hypothetical protein
MTSVRRRPSRPLIDRLTVPFLWIGYIGLLFCIIKLIAQGIGI